MQEGLKKQARMHSSCWFEKKYQIIRFRKNLEQAVHIEGDHQSIGE